MTRGVEKGTLLEERAQLELELTQEQFFCDHIPQKRQLAILGVVWNLVVIVAFACFIVAISTRSVFGIIVGPVLAVFWVIWLFISSKEWKKDLKFLFRSSCDQELAASMARQRKLQETIEELNKEINSIPVQTWNG